MYLGHIKEKESLKLLYQIIKGYSFLKSHCNYPRDYSIDNILVKNYEQIKIDDFGFISLFNSVYKQIHYVHYGMAPELFQGKYYNDKSEVWSLGIIFYKMLFGKYPCLERDIEKYILYFFKNDITIHYGLFFKILIILF